MDVIEPDQVSQRDVVPQSSPYKAPMTEELSRQVNDAILNSWRVDLYKDATPVAPEETILSLGLTRDETTWLKMLMRGPMSRSRARGIDDAVGQNSLDVSSSRLREYDRRLLELLTPKQFYHEIDILFGTDSSADEQDAEMKFDARDDADEICLVDTNRTLPQQKTQLSAVEYSGATSPFGLALEQHLAGNTGDEDDEMNPEGPLELGQDLGVANDEDYSGNDVTKLTIQAETGALQGPHKEFDMNTEDSEYKPPEYFDSPSPPLQDYTVGPFTTHDNSTLQYTAPEAEMVAYQTNPSGFWQQRYAEYGPAVLSVHDSDQPMDLVVTEGNIITNTNVSAGLPLEVEPSASANEHNTESPGPYTKLLTLSNNNSPVMDEIYCPDSKMQELGLREHVTTSASFTVPISVPLSCAITSANTY